MKLFFIGILVFTHSHADPNLKQKIKDFYANPVKSYYSPVEKKFDQIVKDLPAIVRDKQREVLTQTHNKSEPGGRDRAQALFPYQKIETNIYKIDIKAARLPEHPWSDDYWPIYKGVLGNRYADPEFASLYAWKEAFDYFENNKYQPDFPERLLNQLSPAEKFDLLFSNKQFSLTKNMWNQGRAYYQRDGSVEKWMGICHGWAPASYMLPRPTQKVSVTAADGKQITFYPSDIKSLASLLWASGQYNNYFVGGRCNTESPERNDDGRIIRSECRDNNAATFHLALIQGLAKNQESFIIDATYDYEVWNQPLVSYQFEYFNPLNEEPVEKLEDAIIKLADFEKDPFKKYRSKKAVYIVGVSNQITYGVETHPTQREYDSDEYDQSNTAYYMYDLELDANFNVVGGEWYHDQHPDFLWRPAEESEALTAYDYYLLGHPLWDGKSKINYNVSNLANKAAQRGQPLAYVVKSLIQLSNKQGEDNE